MIIFDYDYICRLGLEQIDRGAGILDVNVGVPGIDEAAVSAEAVQRLQAITNVPLQIDTSNYEAMARSLRLYNGKPLLNSVCGKEESLEKVLPLVKKYGAAVVALTAAYRRLRRGVLPLPKKLLRVRRNMALKSAILL